MPKRGDHELDPVMETIAEIRPIRPAAVLVPVVDHPEPTVLLTQRAAHLPDHPGQISFPGGKIDAGDESPLAAALREAEEEIGLDARLVEPIGYLDLYMTTLGYRIVPVIARVEPGFRARAQSRRSGRRIRGAARLPDGSGQPSAHIAEWQGHDADIITQCPSASVTSGASPRASCAICMKGFIGMRPAIRDNMAVMIRPVLTEVVLFVAPFVLYAVFLWATRARVLDPDGVATGDPRLADHRRADLVVGSFLVLAQYSGPRPDRPIPGAYGRRQVRAGANAIAGRER